MSFLQTKGLELIAWLQRFHPEQDPVMSALSILVRPEIIIVFVLPILFFWTRTKTLFPLYVLVMVDTLIGEILRVWLAQPRPWWIADLLPLDPVTSIYSSPGGYASMAVVVYGYLALESRRTWALAVAAMIVALTSVAKMYQAAMMPDHMVLGLVQGAVILGLYRYYRDPIHEWVGHQSAGRQRLWLVGLALLEYGLYWAALVMQQSYNLPGAWAEYRMVPSVRLSDGGFVFALGFAIGAVLGYQRLVATGRTDFQAMPVLRRVAQTVLALVGTIAVFVILRQVVIARLDTLFLVWLVNMGCAIAAAYWVFYGATWAALVGWTRPTERSGTSLMG